MHTSWIGMELRLFLVLLVLMNMVHGKAFLEDAPNEGKHDYYSGIRNGYQPMYDHRSYAANPKLFYTPQINGQPIYIPAISGSEHVNKFLDDYYKINRDYTQSWTLAPPVTYDYDTSSESSYYENGVTTNSMVKNFLEEKYQDGAYSSYIRPATPKNVPKHDIKTIDDEGNQHTDSDNKKSHNRKKKRPHGLSTESSYFTQYKLKTEIPEHPVKMPIKDDHMKHGDKSPDLIKSDVSAVQDYGEMDHIPSFEHEDKSKENKPMKSKIDYSKVVKGKKPNKKDKKHQHVKRKNKPHSHQVSKSYTEDYMNSPDLKFSKKDETTDISEYSTNKIKNEVSVGKNKPGVDSINKLSDDDYEPEIIDVNNDDHEPEIVDVINEDDYEPEVVNVLSNDDYQQDLDVKIPQTEEHLETDYDGSTLENFSSNKNSYSKVKNEKPEKGKHKDVKVSNKPNKHIVKDSVSDHITLYKPEKIIKSTEDESKKTQNKMPADSYVPDDTDEVNKLSDDDYEAEDELPDDYEPEVVDVVNKLSDGDLDYETEDEDFPDTDNLDPEFNEGSFDSLKPEAHLENDETDVLYTSTSEKDKVKPSTPVKTKPVHVKPSTPVKTKPVHVKPSTPVKTKPVHVKPSKPVKTEGHNKDSDDEYNKSAVKSPDLKEIKPPKTEINDKSEENYESDHKIKGKDKDALESVIENQTDNLQEINSRNLLNQQTDIPDEIEEFDGSGSQSIDNNMRRIPQFFKNVESIRNLTSLNTNIWSLIFNPNAERNEPKKCVTRSNETGICTYVQQCEVPNIATSLEQLISNACVIDDMFIGVCCPEFPVQTVKVHWDEMPSNSDKQSEDEISDDVDDCGIRSDEAKKTESWPWQAPLVSMSNGKIFCGGVIIDDDYILTAAHCTTKIPKNQILVRLGQHDETSGDDFAVVEIKRHAQYNPRTMQNDIALLKLGKRISRDKHTGVICLPEDDDDDDHEDEKALLLGRKGSINKSSKQPESLKVMSNKDCEKNLGSKVPATLLCTDARDENERTCNLDSGAPLIVEDDDKYEVIGILSWNRNDCDERFPSTFSRVSKYVRWIQNHIV